MTHALWAQMNAHALLKKRELTMATGSRSAQVHTALLATAHKEVTAKYEFMYILSFLHVYVGMKCISTCLCMYSCAGI